MNFKMSLIKIQKSLILISSLFILLSGTAFLLSGCANAFTGLNSGTSDEALYEDMLKAIDSQDYDTALSKYSSLGGAYKAKNAIKKSYAGALAGKCGFNFINYFVSLQENSPGGVPFMNYLMNAFTGTAVNPTYCTQSEAVIKSIGATAALRDADDNLFMAILSMAKIGAYLRDNADRDGTGSLGDGSADAGFNVCTATPSGSTVIDDTEMTEVVTGLGLIFENFAAISAALSGGDVVDTLTDINNACALLTPNPCAITDAANVTPTDIGSMRDVISTAAANPTLNIGIGSCVDALIAPCCP